MKHKLIIKPCIELLNPMLTYANKGNVIFKCSCGHEVEIMLTKNEDWPRLLSTCDISELTED